MSIKTIVRRQACANLSLDVHPVLKQVFSRRDVTEPGQLDLSLGQLLPPTGLKNIDSACARLLGAIDDDQQILILGDYDTDGATASAVAMLGLRQLGAGAVDYLVPNRFDYGYGLSPEIARVAIERKPDLVITVDNGIASEEGVALLREANIDVIITDHHLAGEKLPDANAIINPNQPGCTFASKALAGVGVMFYLLLAVRAKMRDAGRFGRDATPNLAQLLDLVALGTVADVVPLDYNNRILVAQGIARIQKGLCRPGIAALLEVVGKDPASISSTDLGFVVAPRLNAAGRLDDISMGIECLMAEDPASASELAGVLHEINIERRRIETEMQQQAIRVVEQIQLSNTEQSDTSLGICLHQPDWHQGITGLVASRVKERYQQPVIAFATANDGRLTGSARSVPGLHIRDLLEAIATGHPKLIQKYGGHAMAAGLTIADSDFTDFKTCFCDAVTDHFMDNPPANIIYSDGPLEPEFFTREIAELLRNAAPWGQHFSAPLFDNEFRVLSVRVVGQQHLKLRLATPGGVVDAIAFRQLEVGQPAPELSHIRAAFQLDINEFRGERKLQLIVEHIEPVVESLEPARRTG